MLPKLKLLWSGIHYYLIEFCAVEIYFSYFNVTYANYARNILSRPSPTKVLKSQFQLRHSYQTRLNGM